MADDPRHLYSDPGGGDVQEPMLGPLHGGVAHDPGAGGRESVGGLLRRTRESHGYDLRLVADVLRIRYAYLDAIERGNFDALPGATYAVGFVRSYADFLGLQQDEVVRRFKQEVDGLDRSQQLHFPEPVNEGKVPGGAVLLVSLVLIATAYGGWHVLSSQDRAISDLVPTVPDRLAAWFEGGEAPPRDIAADPGVGGAPADGPESAGTAAEPEGTTRTDAPDTSLPDTSAQVAEPAVTPDDAVPADSETALAGSPPPPAAEQDDAAELAAASPQIQAEAPTESAGTDAAADGASADGDGPADTAAVGEVEAASPPPIPGGQDDTALAAEAPAERDAAALRSEDEAVGGGSEPDDIPAVPSQDGASETEQRIVAEAERVFGAANDGSRITLRATQDSWVQVRGPDNSLLLTRVLNPGDVYFVPNREGLVLHTGNAGGLDILVDGQPAASLGGSGEVVRNISLEADSLR